MSLASVDLLYPDLPIPTQPTKSAAGTVADELMTLRTVVITEAKKDLGSRTSLIVGRHLENAVTKAWRKHEPTFTARVSQAIRSAFVKGMRKAGIAQLPDQQMESLSTQYARTMGDYFTQSSTEGMVEGYHAYTNKKMPQRLAVEKALDTFGLTKRQVRAVVAAEKLEGDKINSVTQIDVKSKITNYIKQAIKERFTLFDAEEMFKAEQHAMQLVWLQEHKAGRMPPGALRMWVTADDEKVCVRCGPMHHLRVDIDKPFIAPGPEEIWTPGLHVNCRCTVRLWIPAVTLIGKAFDEKKINRDPDGRFGKTYDHAQKIITKPDGTKVRVDKGMDPILRGLWSHGVDTWYSCEGGGDEITTPRHGYVFMRDNGELDKLLDYWIANKESLPKKHQPLISELENASHHYQTAVDTGIDEESGEPISEWKVVAHPKWGKSEWSFEHDPDAYIQGGKAISVRFPPEQRDAFADLLADTPTDISKAQRVVRASPPDRRPDPDFNIEEHPRGTGGQFVRRMKPGKIDRLLRNVDAALGTPQKTEKPVRSGQLRTVAPLDKTGLSELRTVAPLTTSGVAPMAQLSESGLRTLAPLTVSAGSVAPQPLRTVAPELPMPQEQKTKAPLRTVAPLVQEVKQTVPQGLRTVAPLELIQTTHTVQGTDQKQGKPKKPSFIKVPLDRPMMYVERSDLPHDKQRQPYRVEPGPDKDSKYFYFTGAAPFEEIKSRSWEKLIKAPARVRDADTDKSYGPATWEMGDEDKPIEFEYTIAGGYKVTVGSSPQLPKYPNVRTPEDQAQATAQAQAAVDPDFVDPEQAQLQKVRFRAQNILDYYDGDNRDPALKKMTLDVPALVETPVGEVSRTIKMPVNEVIDHLGLQPREWETPHTYARMFEVGEITEQTDLDYSRKRGATMHLQGKYLGVITRYHGIEHVSLDPVTDDD